jgi:hypothetical protein
LASRKAIRTYAKYIKEENESLAEDLILWVSKSEVKDE